MTIAGTAPSPLPAGVTFSSAISKPCIFPFRYNGVLYYGCTNDTAGKKLCADSVDKGYNALTIATCNTFCHTQRKFRFKVFLIFRFNFLFLFIKCFYPFLV